MNIRLQPREIDIPKGAPFKNDLLGREEPVKVLTELIGNIEGPCVMAVDAAWGTGKTTFINIWAQYLRDSKFPVVKFNAWDTDFSQDPFVALSVELTDGLSEYVDNTVRSQVADLAARANKLARRLFPTMAKIIGGTAPLLLSDMGPVPEQLIGQAIQSISAGNPSSTSEPQPASYAEERLFEYQDTKKLVKEFRESFQNVANNLSQSNGNRPLIVFIDELDRCRPSYAIELLETAKHLFAVDHILFVLAVNRRELAHSIKGVYGGGFDAVGYLNRFIDLDYQLPDPDRKVFIQESLETVRVIEYLKHLQNVDKGQALNAISLFGSFLRRSNLDLRLIAQGVHRLGLVIASLSERERPFIPTLVALLMIRMIDSELCRRIEQGDLPDKQAVEAMFQTSGYESLRFTPEANLVEAVIIAAKLRSGVPIDEQLDQSQSPLLKEYWERTSKYPPETPEEKRELEHARNVISLVQGFFEGTPGASGQVVYDHLGFQQSSQRIELLWSMLKEDQAQ